MIAVSKLGLSGFSPGLWVNRLVLPVTAGLFILVAYALAEFTWVLMPRPVASPAVEQAPQAARPAKAARAVDTERIAQLHIFGTPAAKVQTAQRPKTLPETKLDLVLRGVLSVETPDEAMALAAMAIVAKRGGRDLSYPMEATLPGGAQLAEIHAEHVVLSRGARYETLRLARPRTGAVPAATGREASARPVKRTQRIDNRANPQIGRALRQYRRQFRENPQSLAGLVSVQPAWEGNQLSGYKLVPGSRKGFLKRFGLEAGDVVKAVNGHTLDSPGKGLDALKALTTADEISLDVARGDKRLLLTFKVPP